jgi:uncharacterized membrane protein
MKLSPEERRQIYEEEKARIEAREHLEGRRGPSSTESSLNLQSNVGAVLCYLGFWITGIIFFVLEQKNRWVRFHAAQSIVVFGALSIIGVIFGWIPILGHVITALLWIVGVILWIVLMVKAYQGERFRVPVAADLAEALTGTADIPYYAPNAETNNAPPASASPPPPAAANEPPRASAAPPTPPQPPSSRPLNSDEPRARKRHEHHHHEIHVHHEHHHDFWDRREFRITGYVVAIAWCVAVFVALNFFHQYIAYYTYDAAGSSWSWNSFFTGDIHKWLPILNAALAVTIIGHLVMIFLDNPIVRRSIHVITTGFGLASVITLLTIYPFDFSANVIPNSNAAAGTDAGVRIALIVIAVGMSIGLLVRIIRLLVNIARAAARPDTRD